MRFIVTPPLFPHPIRYECICLGRIGDRGRRAYAIGGAGAGKGRKTRGVGGCGRATQGRFPKTGKSFKKKIR